MTRITRVTADMSVSLDLVGAGHDQSAEHPFGPDVGERLHTWMFEHGTRVRRDRRPHHPTSRT